MRVSVLQENFARGLSIVNRAISSRPPMPVLANVLISTEEARLKLAATNLELGITTRIGAKVEEDGAITVPAKTLLELISTLPPERVDLELDTKTLTLKITCGGRTATIKGIDANEFPVVPEADEESGLELPGNTLREMIELVAFAAAKEDNRPILTGVLAKFEGTKFIMAAADGYRLALYTTELETGVEQPVTLIVPSRTLTELSRIIPADESKVHVSLPSGRGQVMFHLEAVDVVSQLIDGKFPDYDQIIPKAHTTILEAYTSELLRACKWAEIFARESANTVQMKITPGADNTVPGVVTLAAKSQEKGDNQYPLDAAVNGKELEVSFNVRYLLDILNVLNEEQVHVEFNGSASAGIIKPVGRNNFLYVVMPMTGTR